jgi:hypothetical protein
MQRLPVTVAAFVCLLIARIAAGQDSPSLATAHGAIESIEKDLLKLKVRGADGKFTKPLVLKLTGTSRITTLMTQKRDGKVVLAQKETEVKSLDAKQMIAVIYATEKDEAVLLSAVLEKPAGK